MDQASSPIPIPNSEQFHLQRDDGAKYLVQISWPLRWEPDNYPSLPIIYIVDGNAFFLTATESNWRREFAPQFAGGGIVVAIGYPNPEQLLDFPRRNLDLTPPSGEKMDGFGEADTFLDFIEHSVRPAIKARFPKISTSREALYGHSFGGLFTLHALFCRPKLFDCYIASSPSVWWNEKCILGEMQRFLSENPLDKKPSIVVFWGALEQTTSRIEGEPEDKYEERRKDDERFRMVDNAKELVAVLEKSDNLQTVLSSGFEEEDHTGIMTASVSRGLRLFIEEWPFQSA